MVDTIRILLADDHALVRQGTRELLEQQEDLEVVAEASDGREAVQLAIKESPDVVIMDFSMPELNGIEATRHIKAVAPKIAVLVLTAYDSDQYIFAFLAAGPSL
jgi:DNA-binding NarL/FixJ family response regulator